MLGGSDRPPNALLADVGLIIIDDRRLSALGAGTAGSRGGPDRTSKPRWHDDAGPTRG